jgi:hypothetical protein
MTGAPLLRATGLWKRTSAKGVDYYVGRFGGVRVVILENRDRQADTEPSHFLFFAKASQTGGGAAQRRAEVSPARRRSPNPLPRRLTRESGAAFAQRSA